MTSQKAYIDIIDTDGTVLTDSKRNDIAFYTTTNTQNILFASGSNVNSKLCISSNYVGIGTSTPLTNLQVNGEITSSIINVPRIVVARDYGNSSDILNLNFSTSGQNIYYVDGNVGIGTTNPLYGLDVRGTLNVTSAVSLSNNLIVAGSNTISGTLNVTSAVALSNTLVVSGISTFNSNITLSGTNKLTTGTGATSLGGTLQVTGATALSNNLTVLGNISLSSNLLVSSTGKLGINTTSPAYVSDIIGLSATSYQLITNTLDVETINSWMPNVLSNIPYAKLHIITSGSTSLSSPGQPDILFSRADSIIANGDPLGGIAWHGFDGQSVAQLTDIPSDLNYTSASIQGIAIGTWSTGSAGGQIIFRCRTINTAPTVEATQIMILSADTIYVYGDILTNDTANLNMGNSTRQMINLLTNGSYGIGVQPTTTYIRTGGYFSIFKGGTHVDTARTPGSGGTELLGIDASGNIVIAGSTAYKSAGTTWTVGSDIRLKTDITIANYDRCYEIMSNLDLKHYKWREDIEEYSSSNIADRTKIGWIADDVELYFPKAITEIDRYGISNLKSLDVDQIYACMYGTIKKLMLENEKLNQKDKDLEEKIMVIKHGTSEIISTLSGIINFNYTFKNIPTVTANFCDSIATDGLTIKNIDMDSFEWITTTHGTNNRTIKWIAIE